MCRPASSLLLGHVHGQAVELHSQRNLAGQPAVLATVRNTEVEEVVLHVLRATDAGREVVVDVDVAGGAAAVAPAFADDAGDAVAYGRGHDGLAGVGVHHALSTVEGDEDDLRHADSPVTTMVLPFYLNR